MGKLPSLTIALIEDLINMQHFSGKDGSREIKTLRIDATGTGKSFQAAPASAITKNGVAVS